ncbi:MAG: hypothetical protein ACRBDI_05730 [Alphaproteobacteria bacterium]
MFSLVQSLTSVLRSQEARAVDSHLPKKRGGEQGFSTSDKERDFDRAQEGSPLGSDGAVLSIESLIWFLEDFLEERMKKSSKASDKNIDQDFKPWFRSEASNSNADSPSPRKVAGIYDKNAKTFSATRSSERSSQVEVHSDLKDVYFLIQDLRVLKEHGVQDLVLANDVSFLDGLFLAVEQEKHAL